MFLELMAFTQLSSCYKSKICVTPDEHMGEVVVMGNWGTPRPHELSSITDFGQISPNIFETEQSSPC